MNWFKLSRSFVHIRLLCVEFFAGEINNVSSSSSFPPPQKKLNHPQKLEGLKIYQIMKQKEGGCPVILDTHTSKNFDTFRLCAASLYFFSLAVRFFGASFYTNKALYSFALTVGCCFKIVITNGISLPR